METDNGPDEFFKTCHQDVRIGTNGNYWLRCQSCKAPRFFEIKRLTEKPDFPEMQPRSLTHESISVHPSGALYFNIQFEFVDENDGQIFHSLKSVCAPDKWNELIERIVIPCALVLVAFPMFYKWDSVYADPQTGMVWLTGQYRFIARHKRSAWKCFNGLDDMMHLYYYEGDEGAPAWYYRLVTGVFKDEFAANSFLLIPQNGSLILKDAEYIDTRDRHVGSRGEYASR